MKSVPDLVPDFIIRFPSCQDLLSDYLTMGLPGPFGDDKHDDFPMKHVDCP